jgi:hypothetical protein
MHASQIAQIISLRRSDRATVLGRDEAWWFFLCGIDSNKCYVDGRTTYFDGCEVDTWSPLWIKDFIEQLGHDPAKCCVYWLLPGMSLDEGLRIVDRDIDTLNMTMVVPKF